MRKTWKYILLLAYSLITCSVVWWNIAIHGTALPGSTKERTQVSALLRSLQLGIHDDVPARMQKLFPEGAAFSYALYGLTNCEVARSSTGDRNELLDEARWSLAGLRSEKVRSGFPALLPPGCGIFHAGWSALLEGTIIDAQGVTASGANELLVFQGHCDTIAGTFRALRSPFPGSYNDMAWPADATVAIAALACHDRLLPPRYGGVIRAWVSQVRRTLDNGEGIAHAWDPRANVARGSMRGSSMALLCLLLPEIDPTLAKEQFAVFRSQFFTERFGVPIITEFPKGNWGAGDVDSGPLLLGAGPVAMIVGAGACRANGDAFHDLEMSSTTDGFGLVFGEEERTYLFGAMPIADLFIAWCRARPLLQQTRFQRPLFLRFHAWSALLLLLLWAVPLWLIFRRRRSARLAQGTQ